MSLPWRRRLRTGSAASKASAINTLRFRWVKTSTMPSSTQNPESMERSETRQSLFEYGNDFRGTMWWSGHPAAVRTKLADVYWISYPKKLYDGIMTIRIVDPTSWVPHRSHVRGSWCLARHTSCEMGLEMDGSEGCTISSGSWKIPCMDLTWRISPTRNKHVMTEFFQTSPWGTPG